MSSFGSSLKSGRQSGLVRRYPGHWGRLEGPILPLERRGGSGDVRSVELVEPVPMSDSSESSEQFDRQIQGGGTLRILVRGFQIIRGSKIITVAIRVNSHRPCSNGSNVSTIWHMQSRGYWFQLEGQHCYTAHRKVFTPLVLSLNTSLFHSGHSREG